MHTLGPWQWVDRKGGKWAKITHISCGKWGVAFGWRDQLVAAKLQTGPTRDWATVAANNWINDQH